MQTPSLSTQVIAARKQKGLTQEELAGLTNVTVRTIQRIESGETQPRSFTLKAIAAALDVPFNSLALPAVTAQEATLPSHQEATSFDDNRHFLQAFCLSCFSYIIIPYIHFLIPSHLLKRHPEIPAPLKQFAQKVIRVQIAWMVAFHLLLLATLAYNLLQAAHGNRQYLINYFWVVLSMYAVNAAIIVTNLVRAKQLTTICINT